MRGERHSLRVRQLGALQNSFSRSFTAPLFYLLPLSALLPPSPPPPPSPAPPLSLQPKYGSGCPLYADHTLQVLQEITELVVWGDQNSSRSQSDVKRYFLSMLLCEWPVFTEHLVLISPFVFCSHAPMRSCANAVVDMFIEKHTFDEKSFMGQFGQGKKILDDLQELLKSECVLRVLCNSSVELSLETRIVLFCLYRASAMYSNAGKFVTICLRRKFSASREIRRQLLQTFNMLVQNINNEQVITLIIVSYIKDVIK
jgi:hypothetical protein